MSDIETAAPAPEVTLDQKFDAILDRLSTLDGKADERRLEWFKLAVPSVIAVITIAIGFAQYVSTSSFSVRQPYLTKQTDLCLQASEEVARLASTTDRERWNKARDEFWMLYLGPLAVVEEEGTASPVAGKMIEFGNALKTLGSTTSLPADALRSPSLNVAHACRDLLSSKWRAGLLRWSGNQ